MRTAFQKFVLAADTSTFLPKYGSWSHHRNWLSASGCWYGDNGALASRAGRAKGKGKEGKNAGRSRGRGAGTGGANKKMEMVLLRT